MFYVQGRLGVIYVKDQGLTKQIAALAAEAKP